MSETIRIDFAFPRSQVSKGSYTNRLTPRLAALLVTAAGMGACGTNAAPSQPDAAPSTPAAATKVSFEARGPVGTQVTVAIEASASREELTVNISPPGSDSTQMHTATGEFTQLFPNQTPYSLVSISQSPGLICTAYKGATGTLPIAEGAAKVGCEREFDLIGWNTARSVHGIFSESASPSIGGNTPSTEGRYVAFMSSADLGGNPGRSRQIWWYDRLTGITRLVSANANGEAGNRDSFAPEISADGLSVAFESYATNLVTNDTNDVRDVFVWSSTSEGNGSLRRVSVSASGEQANAESFGPSLSADGKVVAFSSSASNLTSKVSGNSTVNAYRSDLNSGTVTLLSTDKDGNAVGGREPSVSADGNRIAFWSFASTIVPQDSNGLWDIFVYDHAAGTKKRVSVTSTGGERNQGDESTSRVVTPAISGNGQFVAYATTASNVTPDDTNGTQDVFVVEVDTLTVARVSGGPGGSQANADAPIGQGERPAISYDGTLIAYSSAATNLGADNAAGVPNVYLTNRSTGETRSVSRQKSRGTMGVPSMTRSGAYVAFGAGTGLDTRYPDLDGLYVHFTQLARSWWWTD